MVRKGATPRNLDVDDGIDPDSCRVAGRSGLGDSCREIDRHARRCVPITDNIEAGFSKQRVASCSADQDVVAEIAPQLVIPIRAAQLVVARSTIEIVVTPATLQDVIAVSSR